MELISKIKHAQGNMLKLSVFSLLLISCGSKEKKTDTRHDAAVSVKTETLAPSQSENKLILSGNIEGNSTVKLGFMVPGKISRITLSQGQTVQKGSLIASLEPTNYQLNKQLSDVEFKEAKDQFNRIKLLYSKSAISELDYNKGIFTLEKATTQQKLASKNLKDTQLHSSISGILLSKETEVGEIIAAGTPLFIIADIRKVKVSALVPEGELKGLKKGQAAEILIEAIGKNFQANIVEIGAVADVTTRAFSIKMEIDNKDLSIRPGMIAQAKIPLGNSSSGIYVIPESIINDPGNQSYIYVVDKKSKRAFKRKISLGKMSANRVEVLSGLSVGETVVISGQTDLSDGSKIKIDNR